MCNYTGLEPIDLLANSQSDFVFDDDAGESNQIRLIDHGTPDDGYMRIDSNGTGGFEEVWFRNPGNSLTINGLDGDDTIIIDSLDASFAVELIINGGEGNDTLVGPNVANAWAITGLNAGNLTSTLASGSLKTTFAEIEDLTGGSQQDGFSFSANGGVTGSIDDGPGALQITLGQFVTLSGDYSFSKSSGDFVLRICKKHPGIKATVFDLPVVCDVGIEHIRSEPEAERISFVKGNALSDPLPQGFDLITFKSMLHDWPEREAKHFIARAARALTPGGTLLIFERGPLELGGKTPSYSMIPFLLFFRSFRMPELYEEQLRASGFQNINRHRIDLETPFFLVAGIKNPG